MSKPTQAEINTAIKVLEWFQSDTEENEPHAVNTIESISDVRMNLGDVMV